jgi:hypothetical protein
MFSEFSHFNAQLFCVLADHQRRSRKRRREGEGEEATAEVDGASTRPTAGPTLKAAVSDSAASDSDEDRAVDGAVEADTEEGQGRGHRPVGDGGAEVEEVEVHAEEVGPHVVRHRRELSSLFPSATDEEVDAIAERRWMRLTRKERRAYDAPLAQPSHTHTRTSPQRTERTTAAKGDGEPAEALTHAEAEAEAEAEQPATPIH